MEGYIISKIKSKKSEKENNLLDAAYTLFTEKGINNTSIQDIACKAGVAKGTFYLYFKDKYDLQNKLTIKKSKVLFDNALDTVKKNYINNFEDKLIFVVNSVIDNLVQDPTLINFISKDLSLGFYSDKVSDLLENREIGIYKEFMEAIKKNNIKLKNPEVTLFMIIELVSSTCFTAITKNYPLSMEKYKPFLYDTIRLILNEK